MAEIVSKVGSDGGDHYSDLAAWWADKKGDIVTANQIQIAELRGEEHDDGVSQTLNMADLDATTDATRYYHIRTMSGAEFGGDFDDLGSVARITNSYAGSTIVCAVQYTRFENFVVYNHSANVVAKAMIETDGVHCLIDSVGIHNISSSQADGICTVFGIDVKNYSSSVVRNCVVNGIYSQVTGSTASKSATARGILGSSNLPHAYNNTVANIEADNDSTGATCNATASGFFGLDNAKNNLAFAVTASAVNGSASAKDFDDITTQDYNTSEDATAVGANSNTGITPANEVTDTAKATFDCHLLVGSVCVDDGVDLSAEGYSDDIDGDARGVTWDQSADEYVAVGGLSIPIAMHHYKQIMGVN